MASLGRLPARSLSDAPLSDAFDLSGCPVCRRAESSAARFLEGVLYERVNDVAFRADLDRARGFCPQHLRAVLTTNRAGTGGTLSSAILYRAILAVRRSELEAIHRDRGRGRRGRAADAARPASCPVCEQRDRAASDAIGSIVRLSADPAWADGVAAAPFCLAHVLSLFSVPDRPGGWERIEAGQLDRLRHLEDVLAAFAHHSAEDRADLMTAEEVASADEAARVLAGGIE